MPVYEYECAKCGGRVEELQKFSDPPPKKHNGCGGRLKRLLSAPAIQFKGSGWYITDYARKSPGDGAGKSPADGASKDSSSSTPTATTSKDSSATTGSSPTK